MNMDVNGYANDARVCVCVCLRVCLFFKVLVRSGTSGIMGFPEPYVWERVEDGSAPV